MRLFVIVLLSLYTSIGMTEETVKINFYTCKYLTHPIIIKTADVLMKNKSTNSTSICLASVTCELNTFDLGPKYPPQYESWVACLPDSINNCPLDAEVCRADERLEFTDKQNGESKVNEVLRQQKAKEESAVK